MTRLLQGRWKVAGIAATVVFSLSACSSGASPTTAPASAGATTAPASAEATTEPTPAAAKTVGVVGFDTTSYMDKTFAESTAAYLQSAGFEVLSQDPKGDLGQANTICAQYVTRQVDAIVVTTFALDQMAQCMAQTKAANIPVVFIASPLVEGMAGAVDVTAPPPINDVFVKYLKDNGITDTLALDYSPGTPCRMRAAYREDLLASSGLSVKETKFEFHIPGQVVESQNATAAWLAAHPEGSGKFAIWSCFADSASGAGAALNQVGRTDAPIFTWDLTKAIVPAVQSGQIAADLFLDAKKVGEQAGQLVEGYLNGDTTPKGVAAANVILNKDNIDQFLKDNPDVIK
ncbi:MAG: sugar ABC transporter substrate-binding protein [Candidatus Limnocylindrales bacterium]